MGLDAHKDQDKYIFAVLPSPLLVPCDEEPLSQEIAASRPWKRLVLLHHVFLCVILVQFM